MYGMAASAGANVTGFLDPIGMLLAVGVGIFLGARDAGRLPVLTVGGVVAATYSMLDNGSSDLPLRYEAIVGGVLACWIASIAGCAITRVLLWQCRCLGVSSSKSYSN
jgi:hypothetical protein